jgi:hypothetical protein
MAQVMFQTTISIAFLHPHWFPQQARSATWQTSSPQLLICANVKSGYKWLSTCHTVLACRARMHLSTAPTKYDLGVVNGPVQVVRELFLPLGVTVLSASIVNLLSGRSKIIRIPSLRVALLRRSNPMTWGRDCFAGKSALLAMTMFFF